MIPLSDHNPTKRTAIIVPSLIVLNVIMFLFVQPTLRRGQSPQEELLTDLKFYSCSASIPYEVTHGRTVAEGVADGSITGEFAEVTAQIQEGSEEIGSAGCPRKSVVLSIFVSMFLHGGWLHIAGNMLFLWVFGNNIEDRMGRLRFIAFYLISGLIATGAQSVASSGSARPLIGASGAVAGVLGAYLVTFPRARVNTLIFLGFFITRVELPAILVLGVWFLMQAFSVAGTVSTDSGVAYIAHIGGFLAGIALLYLMRPRRTRALPY